MRLLASNRLAFALLLGLGASSRADDPPSRGPSDPPPIYVIVDAPTDLDSLLKKLGRPDFVILKGGQYDRLRALEAKPPTPDPPRAVVEAVSASGEVVDDLAHLTIDLRVSLVGPEPSWVPIRLDGPTVREAREGDRALPLRTVEGSWQVEVRGEGTHKVRVDAVSPVLTVRGLPDLRRVEWAIPEAASTRVELSLPAGASEAFAIGGASGREPLAVEPIEAGQRGRIAASLTPRRRLELTWRAAPDPGPVGPPLLTAVGEIALTVERGSVRARSSWDVQSQRGTARRLELRIDPADELVALECDGRPVSGEGPVDPASGTVVVPLPEPLRPQSTTRLVVTTRRALAPGSASRMTYRGVPLVGVASQRGVIAVSETGGDPWVSGSAGRGLRRVDPKGELTSGLRNQPSIVLAYSFNEQPFELGLQVDPSPPWVRAESRTTVIVEPGRARVDSWLEFAVSRGRVFEVKIAVPPGMIAETIGPEGTISGFERTDDEAGPALVARLSARASEDRAFRVHLTGSQAIETAGPAPVEVGLFRPMGVQSRGGRVAVLRRETWAWTCRRRRPRRSSRRAWSLRPAGTGPPIAGAPRCLRPCGSVMTRRPARCRSRSRPESGRFARRRPWRRGSPGEGWICGRIRG